MPAKPSAACSPPGLERLSPRPMLPHWCRVSDQFRPKVPKRAILMVIAGYGVLPSIDFPWERQTTTHSANPIDRLKSYQGYR
jgi:hypothetical protein